MSVCTCTINFTGRIDLNLPYFRVVQYSRIELRDLLVGQGLPLDFISTHFYNSDPNCTRNDTAYGADPDCFSKVVLAARSWAEEAGLPFLLTEYNAAYYGHDTSYAAAFLIRNIPLLTELDVLSYWSALPASTASHYCHPANSSQPVTSATAGSLLPSATLPLAYNLPVTCNSHGAACMRYSVQRYLRGRLACGATIPGHVGLHDQGRHPQASVASFSIAASVGRSAA